MLVLVLVFVLVLVQVSVYRISVGNGIVFLTDHSDFLNQAADSYPGTLTPRCPSLAFTYTASDGRFDGLRNQSGDNDASATTEG